MYENSFGIISNSNGRIVSGLQNYETSLISPEEAQLSIINNLKIKYKEVLSDSDNYIFGDSELILFNLNNDYNSHEYRYCYNYTCEAVNSKKAFQLIVDATSGGIIYSSRTIREEYAEATGSTFYSGLQNFTTELYGGNYILKDENRKISTFDMNYGAEENFIYAESFEDSDNNWNDVMALISTISVNSVNSAWSDEFELWPELYIKFFDNVGELQYITEVSNPVISFPEIFFNITIIQHPFVVEIWEKDYILSDDLVGGFYISDLNTSYSYTDGLCNIDIHKSMVPNPALDVHWGMQKVYDFYKNNFNRDSYNNLGSPINSYIFYSPTADGILNNASADSYYNIMKFGLGDGILFNPFVSLDIAGHEFTHLVINSTSNLDYFGESGALNESFADMMGTAIDFGYGSSPNWTHGENYLNPTLFTRSLSNPNLSYGAFGGHQPDTYQGLFWYPTDCGIPDYEENDYCGVHYNSGVPNFWFYLMCEGGYGLNDIGNEYNVTPIGITNATKIAYHTLINLDETSDFFSAAVESKTQALLLFPEDSSIYNSVINAWYAVGVWPTPADFCLGLTEVYAESGEITDGSVADLYGNNSNCSWLISPPGATSITLEFSEFFTEYGHDSVIVYNGGLIADPVLLSWSGNSLPPEVSSTGGEMLIVFNTDGDNNDYGWTANYSSITEPVGCSGTVTLNASSGYFSDGSGTNDYTNNNNCIWLIAPTSASSVTLNFTSFITEATYDFVKVYDGSNAASPLIGTYSGGTIPPSITSSGGTLYVVFISDGSITASGWTANYTSDGIDPITTSMSSYEYWFDSNYIEKVTGTISGPTPAFSEIIDVNSLTNGLHSFHIRFKDNNDLWGSILSQFFVKSEPRVDANTINDAEYWFDNDYDSKIELTDISQEVFDFNDIIDVSGLVNGLHSFHIRFRDENNLWCGVLTQYFVTLEQSVSDNTIIDGEYWFDNNYAENIDLLGINAETFSLNNNIDVNSLTNGLHSFHIRFKDANNLWSSVVTQFFIKTQSGVAENVINSGEYWFDNNYAGNIELVGINAETFNFTDNIDVNSLTNGLHSFHIRFKDANNLWSSALTQFFVKVPQITTPNLISTYEYWFDSDPYASAISVTLPTPINPYHLNDVVDVSALTEASHTIHFRFQDINGLWSSVVTDTFSREPLILAGFTVSPISICAGASVTFDNLSQGATSYLWDFGDGTTSTAFEPTHIYSIGGSYTVTLTASNIGEGISDILTIPNAVTVIQPNPIITASGPTTFCSGSTVTLSTATGFTSYQWYRGVTPLAGATNSNYTTNKSGSYTVKVFQGTCFATSSATVVTVNPLPKATVSNLDATNDLCLDASIKLKANSGTGYTYQWYKGASMLAGATAQIYYATIQGNYKVKVTAATGCNKTSTSYSIIKTCKEEGEIESITQLTVFPNPNDGKYTLVFNSECNSELSVTIFDAVGRLILEDKGKIEDNIFSENYDLSGYAKGSYLVKVVCDEGAHYVNVVVQ
jgi:Zn-dependent metalloprotease/PKD repeat protein